MAVPNLHTTPCALRGAHALLVLAALLLNQWAGAAQTDISPVHMANGVDSVVLPNVMFILDDSGSMADRFETPLYVAQMLISVLGPEDRLFITRLSSKGVVQEVDLQRREEHMESMRKHWRVLQGTKTPYPPVEAMLERLIQVTKKGGEASFLIVTDGEFTLEMTDVPIWYDVILLIWFSWTGVLLGVVSLYIMHMIVSVAFGRWLGWAFVLIVSALSSLGIYLGRFGRFNSWDIFQQPSEVALTLLGRVIDPSLRLVVFTGSLTAFFLFVDLTLYAFGHLLTEGSSKPGSASHAEAADALD